MKRPKPLKPGQVATFQFDPYYDEVLIFADTTVPTSQDKLKLIDKEKGIYELRRKPNVITFEEHIRERLLTKKKAWWPYTEFLDIELSITGSKKQILHKDLDNYLKTLFDVFKGVVYDDDYKIMSVKATKTEVPQMNGFMIFITKKPKKGETMFFYSRNPDNWEKEADKKLALGGACVIDSY
jgi:Holliday junction resolvase RusA-like endonuclease